MKNCFVESMRQEFEDFLVETILSDVCSTERMKAYNLLIKIIAFGHGCFWDIVLNCEDEMIRAKALERVKKDKDGTFLSVVVAMDDVSPFVRSVAFSQIDNIGDYQELCVSIFLEEGIPWPLRVKALRAIIPSEFDQLMDQIDLYSEIVSKGFLSRRIKVVLAGCLERSDEQFIRFFRGLLSRGFSHQLLSLANVKDSRQYDLLLDFLFDMSLPDVPYLCKGKGIVLSRLLPVLDKSGLNKIKKNSVLIKQCLPFLPRDECSKNFIFSLIPSLKDRTLKISVINWLDVSDMDVLELMCVLEKDLKVLEAIVKKLFKYDQTDYLKKLLFFYSPISGATKLEIMKLVLTENAEKHFLSVDEMFDFIISDYGTNQEKVLVLSYFSAAVKFFGNEDLYCELLVSLVLEESLDKVLQKASLDVLLQLN